MLNSKASINHYLNVDEEFWRSWHDTLGVIHYDAKRYDPEAQRTPHVIMARVITNAPPKWRVIHLDGNHLNNQRGNLLLLSAQQYAQTTVAARAYDTQAIERFGESARLNFPREFKVCHECHRGFFELRDEMTCRECQKN